MKRALLWVLLTASPLAASDPRPHADARTATVLSGTWVVTRLEVDGTVRPLRTQLVFVEKALTFGGGDVVLADDLGEPRRASLRYGPEATPRQLDLLFAAEGGGHPWRFLYEADGDQLRLAFYRDDHARRPPRLVGREGEMIVLVTLERKGRRP